MITSELSDKNGKERYGVKGKDVYDSFLGLLNIEFVSEQSARLCCNLLNQKEREKKEYIDKIDELFKWYKDYYGETILDTRMGWNK